MRKLLLWFFILLAFDLFAVSKDMERVVDLDGIWKFEIGDDPEWSRPEYRDDAWEDIPVPSRWEEEGFPGYDGFAWYRKHFTISTKLKDETLFLVLGQVDDADEVYLNGKMLGYCGHFPPNFQTMVDWRRAYFIPRSYLNFDSDNLVAIKVYDGMGSGGIISGNCGISVWRNTIRVNQSLEGEWKFKIGDDPDWQSPDQPDDDWETVIAPLTWEANGYMNYDGMAWYRKKFILKPSLKNERIIFVAGEIDDLDEAFLNGHKIGATGSIRQHPEHSEVGTHARELRAYYIPRRYIDPDGENVLAIRVYDGTEYGGIKEGPLGIVTRKRYMDWKRNRSSNNFKSIIDNIFNN